MFLERAVTLKEQRLSVLDGINRLDDIARGFLAGSDMTDDIGGWFAEHSSWLSTSVLKEQDRNRITQILSEIRRELRVSDESSAAVMKITTEIRRWQAPADEPVEKQVATESAPKLVLKRLSEAQPPPAPFREQMPTGDTIAPFDEHLENLVNLYKDIKEDRQHLLTVLDDALKSAGWQQNKDALLLAGLIIYYLRLHGYMVEPYVKRLKECESGLKRTN